ncbi:MAG: V-type ATP synthase subunit E [Nitrosarchaeum sp.]|nr:V-type ATP synthase subunit E [Nitrosarchaeum sp.]
MASATLEKTIDKILGQTENNVLSSIESALTESQQKLDDAIPKLEQEYDKIISDGKKEAEKMEKQIIGSSDLEVRNKQLMTLEDAVNNVFTKAIEQIGKTDRNSDYSNLIRTLLRESTKILGTSDITVLANSKDKDVVQSLLAEFPGSELSANSIDCLGGIIVKSKDGSMTFDNTLDAKIERLKPLIRKEIASKFGVGN